MSLSKEQGMVAPRQPKCTRCRHHGIIVPQKGHIKYCPFLKCDCWKCYLITQRTRITALQRNLKRTQNKEQRACGHPAAEGTCCASAPDGGASPSATSGLTCPPSGGAQESAANTNWSPLDLRIKPAEEGENVAALDSREVLPFASSEEGPSTPFNAPYFGEYRQTSPLPFIHYPVRMSGPHPSSCAPCANVLFRMPWLPPVPAGLYNNSLCGPLMFPHFQSGAVQYPPPPNPAADCGTVFFTVPEPFQDELMSRQPPLSEQTQQDIQQLDSST
ncbi:doublesex- and mab-3-related transcription factor 1Y-like [Micropterus dolomieu]|uniref:doublesex- and mab-3-related transcription factor 1Y-like n=1 Tax=Micropterus dolomieu TaxID=147949 RepID=UPI001E8DFF63|nr:doublesex- and mab-3-related transcription factor 1Y-like [Micropterus dolomieu]